MKFTLLVVGRTVEKHYITAINDYVERTKHYVSFDMEVIPELKNTKSLSMEQQKKKGRRSHPESLAARRCSSIARRAWKRIPLHRVCQLDRAENAYRKQAAGVHHRRTLRILSFRLSGCPGKDFTFQNDIFAPNDTAYLRGTALPGHDHSKQRPLPPRINRLSQPQNIAYFRSR